jgi:nicotinate-nucleotide adenylyltransferase
MHVGIFGGSFDPPHIGHLIVAEWMRDAFGLDRILWIPAARSPHKLTQKPADDDLRLKMVRAAVENNPYFQVSDLELRRGGLSYTLDTLEHLSEENPDDRFSLILGSDSLKNFDRWHRPEQILKLADLLVFRRPGSISPDVPSYIAKRLSYSDAPLLEISATEIRRRCADGGSIRYLVPAPVAAIIDAHNLYR